MMRSSSLLLALDTSTRTAGIALYDGAQVLNEIVWSSPDYHTVELAPLVAESLRRCNLTVEALSAIAVATGPGSFTGLRVGLALAKGIALARRLPLIGVPTLDALAAAQPLLDMPLLALVRTGRGRFAVQRYHASENGWQALEEITILTLEALLERLDTPTWICGELTAEERQTILDKQTAARLASPAQSLRRPSFLAEVAWKRWKSGHSDDPIHLVPLYIHYNQPIPTP